MSRDLPNAAVSAAAASHLANNMGGAGPPQFIRRTFFLDETGHRAVRVLGTPPRAFKVTAFRTRLAK
ncbi:hypothetical protein GLOTRDRAFT_110141 [Gloeophyllum trabeum ATCC 11539]|uniref:Uncharacterized protein n=1 Tax=Gloeophyllum trabeum (strain ATCC 11539 / FP-39264 / Madison 617) TaxID=670483 RepID=S7RY52_GLOTA|nr:uncharacterized protein GLOTRDRAFT_110141 [Gloeophyllum trabeum ATCC 11539]EPQ58334.1 hypothetical protein GLOTRDRAFT_110141 [Gloeophyllum trabeum ATCC 11539]